MTHGNIDGGFEYPRIGYSRIEYPRIEAIPGLKSGASGMDALRYADLSPHNAISNPISASNPKNEAPCFSTGISQP